jgi:hypothetical protein
MPGMSSFPGGNLEDAPVALRDAMDDLETFEWRGVDPLWGLKP